MKNRTIVWLDNLMFAFALGLSMLVAISWAPFVIRACAGSVVLLLTAVNFGALWKRWRQAELEVAGYERCSRCNARHRGRDFTISFLTGEDLQMGEVVVIDSGGFVVRPPRYRKSISFPPPPADPKWMRGVLGEDDEDTADVQ